MTSQTDIDRILGVWLSEGADHAPEDRLRAALSEVSSTSQKRIVRLPHLLGPSDRSLPPAALFAVIGVAILAIVGLGLGVKAGFIRLPMPTQLPAPASSPPATTNADRGLVDYRYPAAGFEISLPEEWNVTSTPDEAALTARSDATHIRLYVSSGDSAGRLVTCQRSAGPWESCEPRVATDRRSLGQAIAILPQDDHGVGPPTARLRQITLDGEPATMQSVVAYEYPAAGSQAVTWVVAMHSGRPYVVRLSWSVGREIPDVASIISGFRFLATGEAVTHRGPAGTYALSVPGDWVEPTSRKSGYQSFTVANGGRTRTVLKIRSSLPGGAIELCLTHCATFNDVESLDDLGRALHDPQLRQSFESPYGTITPRNGFILVRGETVLGGAPARFEGPASGGVSASGGFSDSAELYYHVWTTHEGVAVVLSFDSWAMNRGLVSDEQVDAILQSFRFTDG
jgi:hypothetical protein